MSQKIKKKKPRHSEYVSKVGATLGLLLIMASQLQLLIEPLNGFHKLIYSLDMVSSSEYISFFPRDIYCVVVWVMISFKYKFNLLWCLYFAYCFYFTFPLLISNIFILVFILS